MTLFKPLVAPTPPPAPQAALALPSSSSSPLEVKHEPTTPLPVIKCEALSPHSLSYIPVRVFLSYIPVKVFLSYIPVKVEDLGALLASLVAQGEDHWSSVSLPATNTITDTICDILYNAFSLSILIVIYQRPKQLWMNAVVEYSHLIA